MPIEEDLFGGDDTQLVGGAGEHPPKRMNVEDIVEMQERMMRQNQEFMAKQMENQMQMMNQTFQAFTSFIM